MASILTGECPHRVRNILQHLPYYKHLFALEPTHNITMEETEAEEVDTYEYVDPIDAVDEDATRKSDLVRAVMRLTDFPMHTPLLQSLHAPRFAELRASIPADDDELLLVFNGLLEAALQPPPADWSFDTAQGLCDTGTLRCEDGVETWPLKMAVKNSRGQWTCVAYSLRDLAMHIDNYGWTDPRFKHAFEEGQIAHIKRVMHTAGKDAFMRDGMSVVPLHDFGIVNVLCRPAVPTGYVIVDSQALLEELEGSGYLNATTTRLSGPNTAVFCKPLIGTSISTCVFVGFDDYKTLTAFDHDDFSLHLVGISGE